MQKVLDELSSNEAFQYVQKLETEVDKLRKQLKDVTSQLQNAKVSRLTTNKASRLSADFYNVVYIIIL